MITVWKSNLHIAAGVQDLALPKGAEILTAREQGENIAIWYRCDEEAAMEKRRFVVVPTGGTAPTPEGAAYLGQAQMEGGMYIFHIFEILDVFITH